MNTPNDKITVPNAAINGNNTANVFSSKIYYECIQLMIRAGVCLKIPRKTINSAIMVFHRFFSFRDITECEESYVYDVCRCALLSATKIEETPCRIRDILNTTYKLIYPCKKLPIPMDREWDEWKARIISTEETVLSEIGFQLNAVCPHQFVLFQCNDLKTSTAVAKLSWSVANDCMYSQHIMLSYPPHQISAAAIFVAMQFLQCSNMQCFDIGDDEYDQANHARQHPQCWWRMFDVDDDTIQTVASLIMDVYESELVAFSKPTLSKQELGHKHNPEQDEDQEDEDDDDECIIKHVTQKEHKEATPNDDVIAKKVI